MVVSVATPAIIRERSKTRKDVAKEKKMKLIQDMIIEMRRRGFLPNLSEALPSRGEKMNCMMEKEATRSPILDASDWKVNA